MNAGPLVGHYFRILAFVSLLALPVSLMVGKGPSLDLSFILLFWVGRGLLQLRKTARRVAVWICGVFVLLAGGSLIQSLLSTAGPSLRMQGGAVTPALAVFECSRWLLYFLPPYVLLMLPATRRMYLAAPADPSSSPSWTGRHTAAHVVGAGILIALSLSNEHSVGTTTISRSTSSVSYGQRALGITVLSHYVDERSKANLFVSSWVLGEHNATDGGRIEPTAEASVMKVGSYEVHPPDPRAVHYLRGIDSFPEPLHQANILIVRADGRIITVPRRVTLATLAAAKKAIQGLSGFDEMQQRLEALLPPLPPP